MNADDVLTTTPKQVLHSPEVPFAASMFNAG